ncbi:FAD-binding protein [Brachybacterium huguangmaarense]
MAETNEPTTHDGRGVAGTNWSRTYAYRARGLAEPTSLDELRRVVAGTDRVRALGTQHSFSPIADTDGTLVSLGRMPAEVDIDAEARTVRVAAGMRYGDLAGHLDRAGLALGAMASLPHISVAGSVATATHGSGVTNRCLAAAVVGLELLDADGHLHTITRQSHPDEFDGMVVGLGSLGVVTALTLAVEPAYAVRQAVYLDLPGDRLDQESLETVLGCAYSVSLFTRWQTDGVDQVWIKHRTDGVGAGSGSPLHGDDALPVEILGARRSAAPIHPLPAMPAAHCTDQSGEPGPFHERLPHFRLEFTPSSGDEIQSEYLIPREHLSAAMAALRPLGHLMDPVLHVSEVRTVAADDLWLSMAQGRDSAALHFTWTQDAAGVAAVLPRVEEALAPFAPRPHWGKVFGIEGDVVRGRYPRADDFAALAGRWDPRGVFAGAMVEGERAAVIPG